MLKPLLVIPALLAGVIAFGASLAPAPSALATPPESFTVIIDETFTDDETCAFPITIHAEGRIKFTLHFDRAGNPVFESQTPSIRLTVTNPANGNTLRDADVGLDKVTFTPDGGVFVLSTGIHSRVLPERGAPIFMQVGLRIIIVDAEGNFEVRVIGGNFDPDEEFQPTVCAYFAGS